MAREIELEGDDRLRKLFERAAGDAAVRRGLGQAMHGFATKVLNESKKIVPVDTANLRDSGMVSSPNVDSDTVEVEITYGGSSAPYAAIVHEDMTLDHSPANLTAVTKRPRRGQAKYLETPVMAQAPSFAREIAARYANYVRRGG